MHLGKGQNVPWKTPKMRLEGKYKKCVFQESAKNAPNLPCGELFLELPFPLCDLANSMLLSMDDNWWMCCHLAGDEVLLEFENPPDPRFLHWRL